MNTRSTSDKAEVNNLYKTAIENPSQINSRNPTLHTSTLTGSFKPKSIDFSLNDSVIAKDQSEIFVNTPEPASDSWLRKQLNNFPLQQDVGRKTRRAR